MVDLNALASFNELVNKLQANSSRLVKEELLRQYGSDTNKALLWFIFNPYIVTGISAKKAEKYKGKINVNRFSLLDLLEEPKDYNNLTNMFNYFKEHNTGKDEDLIELEKYSQNNAPYQDLIYSIVTKDLKLGITSTTLNKIYGDGFIPTFDVMLAYKYFDDPDKFVPEGTEFILTTKLDGVRCVLLNYPEGPKFYSRQGQLFEGLVELEEEARKLPVGYVFDGELLLDKSNMVSKDLYRETMKVVSADKEKHNVIFNCFDLLFIEDFEKGYFASNAKTRKQKVHDLLTGDFKFFKEVKELYIGTDKSQIEYWLNKITSEGGEGVMINIANAPYECKRTKNLLKVKRFQTCDVKVIGLEEGTGQNKGKLGALKIEFIGPDGKIYNCDVGSGLTLEQREDFWEHKDKVLNKIIEISYFEISSNQNGTYGLRFPVFKWLREDKNEISMY